VPDGCAPAAVLRERRTPARPLAAARVKHNRQPRASELPAPPPYLRGRTAHAPHTARAPGIQPLNSNGSLAV
jgi:hypothetical protein